MIYITQTAFTFLNDQIKSGKISEETSPVQIKFPFQRTNRKIFPSQNLRGKFSPKKEKKTLVEYSTLADSERLKFLLGSTQHFVMISESQKRRDLYLYTSMKMVGK